MSTQKHKRLGLIASGMKVQNVVRRAIPNSNAGGNVQVTFPNGNRVVAWKGSENYEALCRLRQGDVIDFSFTNMRPGEYTAGATGATVEYSEFVGVELILKKEELELTGFQAGQGAELPEALRGREMIDEVAPRTASPGIAPGVQQEQAEAPASTDGPDL